MTPAEELSAVVASLKPDRAVIVTDSNVRPIAEEYISAVGSVVPAGVFILPPGEQGKSLEQLASLAAFMSQSGLSRNSLVVNIGGGCVSDLGGFAAAVFKRGVRTVNVATTILAAVDAAIGGKTAVDFLGLKNQLGAFHIPERVIIADDLLRHLPREEYLSGLGEVLKTAMLDSRELYLEVLKDCGRSMERPYTPENSDCSDKADWAEKFAGIISRCAEFKEEVVRRDPEEKGLRRILNLGHTAGHAFEALAARKGDAVSHGTAVAHGLLVSLILSHIKCGFPSLSIYPYRELLQKLYRRLPVKCSDAEALADIMRHDKKNTSGTAFNFVLLRDFGVPEECVPVSKEELLGALDIYCDMMG